MSSSMPEGRGPLLRERLRTARLYFVCDARPPGGDLERTLRATLGGGVDIVQLREKELGRAEIERAADTYRRVADTFSALFIVNDDPDLARACDADGVHVGEVGEVAAARELLGPDAIVGVSTHSPEQIAAADAAAVDYIAVGPIWETPTKPGRPAVGLELISHAAEHSHHPFFAIGGISPFNAEEVVRAGARRLAVVRAIRDAPHPEVAAEALRRTFAAADAGGPNTQDALLDSPAPWRGVAPGG
ncbi:MAG TPA: thiamine phosphate synthase [Solirubrobacterales bacterium]